MYTYKYGIKQQVFTLKVSLLLFTTIFKSTKNAYICVCTTGKV